MIAMIEQFFLRMMNIKCERVINRGRGEGGGGREGEGGQGLITFDDEGEGRLKNDEILMT